MHPSSSSSSKSPPLSPQKITRGEKADPGPNNTSNNTNQATHNATNNATNNTSNTNNQSRKGVDKSKRPSPVITAHTPTRGHNNENSNTTNINYPYSSMSPRVRQTYIIERTQSSPCVLDASPKRRVDKRVSNLNCSTLSPIAAINIEGRPTSVQVLHHTSQLTPVTRNTTRSTTLSTLTNKLSVSDSQKNNKIPHHHHLSLPENCSFKDPAKSAALLPQRGPSISSSSSSISSTSTSSSSVSSANIPRRQNQNHTMIRPRNASSVWTQSRNTGGNSANVSANVNVNAHPYDASTRPLSPPSWSSHRVTTVNSTKPNPCTRSVSVPVNDPVNTGVSANSNPIPAIMLGRNLSETQPRPQPQLQPQQELHPSNFPLVNRNNKKDRFASPLDTHVKLDRNHYSFDTQPHPYPAHLAAPITGSSLTGGAGVTLPSTSTLLLPQQSSPESSGGTPQPRSPAESLFVPYQPSRDSSLASFGVVSDDDLDDIFLPLRTTNKFRRSSKDKVVFVGAERGGFGVNNVQSKLHRSGPLHGNDDDCVEEEEEDCFTHISDSQSSISIPSIRLGARILSSTQDSSNTTEGAEEGRSYSASTFDEDEDCDSRLGLNLGSHHHHSSAQQEGRMRKKNHHKHLSSKKEKQVYAWLKTLEVDRDNNEYVAEAASSKFLTGKMNTVCASDRYFAAEFGRVDITSDCFEEDDEQLLEEEEGELEEIKECQQLQQENINHREDKKVSLDSTAKTVKASTKNVVMGRNLDVYGGGPLRSTGRTAKSNTSVFKVSGLYR